MLVQSIRLAVRERQWRGASDGKQGDANGLEPCNQSIQRGRIDDRSRECRSQARPDRESVELVDERRRKPASNLEAIPRNLLLRACRWLVGGHGLSMSGPPAPRLTPPCDSDE